MKICVYAIAKNEENNVQRWYDSMKEADDIYVLDTGSTDKTVQKLKELNVHVETKIIDPWRFDVARNESLKLVPDDTDFYVCSDLDEVFNKGWRKILEDNILSDTTKVKYLCNSSFGEDHKPKRSMYIDKIHTKGYHWTHRVHEVLTSDIKGKIQLIEGIVSNHYNYDIQKRHSSYLNLLQESVLENPNDPRDLYLLGREYMNYNENLKAIETFHKYLLLPSATWKEQKCTVMRYMARCYNRLNYIEEAIMWYQKAEEETPLYRESYVELAGLYNRLKKHDKVLEELDKAFKIKEKPKDYISEASSWNGYPYDLYALNAYHLGKYKKAVFYNRKALKFTPDDERLKKNQKIYNNALKKANEI